MTAPLTRLIRERIESEGPLSVARFMEMALQHPDYGYYRWGDPLGREGDFVTAPEISQMFGEMIGLWLVDLWQRLGRPPSCALLEAGPGRGTLLKDALRATAKVAGFHDALEILLLESSATLRQKQRETLAAYAIRHIDSPGALPGKPLLFVANEFFDALPIFQFVRKGAALFERKVVVQDEGFAFAEVPVPAGLLSLPGEEEDTLNLPFPDERACVLEVGLQARDFLREIAAHVARHGGGGLIVDYGYAEAPCRSTLQAVARHGAVDALANPGAVDITAHVNFPMLARVLHDEGLRVRGPVGQGAFLEAMGIGLRASLLTHGANDAQNAALQAGLRRLTDPAQMGALFKVLGFEPHGLTEGAGFP